jgi:hypothetical protein
MKNGSLGIKEFVEITSALAVVISLAFVGLQMNENTKATRSAIAAEMTASVTDWYNELTQDMEASTNFRDFIADPETQTKDEQYRAIMRFHALMFIFQSSFYLEQEGTLDTQLRRSITAPLHAVSANSGLRFYWKQRKAVFLNKEFIAFVENAIESPGTNSAGLYVIEEQP